MIDKWRVAAIGFSTDRIEIGGIDVFAQPWRSANMDAVRLPHPTYPQQIHAFYVYDIGNEDHPIRFAAAELSNGVWGFYLPEGNST